MIILCLFTWKELRCLFTYKLSYYLKASFNLFKLLLVVLYMNLIKVIVVINLISYFYTYELR